MNQTYLDTAKALVAAAPPVFFDDTFALKGGTARPHPAMGCSAPAHKQQPSGDLQA
jgi:hypothetical protein